MSHDKKRLPDHTGSSELALSLASPSRTARVSSELAHSLKDSILNKMNSFDRLLSQITNFTDLGGIVKQITQMQRFAGVDFVNQFSTADVLVKQLRSMNQLGDFGTADVLVKQLRSMNQLGTATGRDFWGTQLWRMDSLAKELRQLHRSADLIDSFASQARLTLVERLAEPTAFHKRLLDDFSHEPVAVKRLVFKNIEDLTAQENEAGSALADSLSEIQQSDGPLIHTSASESNLEISIEIQDPPEHKILEINELQARIDHLTALLAVVAEQNAERHESGLIQKVGLVEVEFDKLDSAQNCHKIAVSAQLKDEITVKDKMLSLSVSAYKKIAQTWPDLFALFLCCLFDHYKLLGGADAGVLVALILRTLGGIRHDQSNEK